MIHSTSNTKVKLARSLHRRAARQREGLVIAEGSRLIEEILRTGIQPVLSFCTAKRQQEPHIAALLQKYSCNPLPVTPAVMKAMSNMVTPPGLLAVFPMPQLSPPSHLHLIVILDQVREPGNVGTILRSALAAGVDWMLLSAGCSDTFNPKTLRAGMGAHFRLPITPYANWEDIRVSLAGMQTILADPRGDESYDEIDWMQPTALIVGGEAEGASRKAIETAQHRVAIPMSRNVESLNTAVAAGVILFEAARQRRKAEGGA